MQKQLTQKKHLSDHSRFYDQNLSTVTLKLKLQYEITEKLFFTFFFHRLCSLELTVLAKKDTTQRKKIRKRVVNKTASQDHKTKKQKRLTQDKHLLDHTKFYGVMVSNLDADSNDSSFNFVELLLKMFCSNVD